jgi:hypothetical protein
LKERRERIEGCSVLEKGEKGGGGGVRAKQPSSTSPLTIQNRGAGGPWPAGGGAAPAGGPVHGDGREVGQNEEEFDGNRFRLLPWAGVLWRGGSMAGGGTARGGGRGGTGGGDGGLGEEGEMVVEVRGATESRAGPFIRAGRSVRARIFEL